MARYEHLPIYKQAFDLTLYFENTVRHFSRYHKYTLGTELRERARRIVQVIVQANDLADKVAMLLTLRAELEQLKLTLRLCKEVQAFHNANSFQVAMNHVIALSKQNEGWMKKSRSEEARLAGHGQQPGSTDGQPSA